MSRVLAGKTPVGESEELSAEDRAREMLVLGLRRLDGVSREAFRRATGYEIEQLAGGALARYVELGLLADHEGRVRLTREGLFVSDGIWPAFLRA